MEAEEENIGDYYDEEENEEIEIEQDEPSNSPLGSKQTPSKMIAEPETSDSNVDYPYNIVSRSQVLSTFKGKILELAGKFEFADIDRSVFWKFLRENRYLVRLTASKLEERIFDFMDSREIKKLSASKNYTCEILGDEYPSHLMAHFGCGHTVFKDCMADYLQNEINTKGRGCISSTCPKDKCPYQVTEELVVQYCDKPTIERFQNIYLADYLESYPCISQCSNPGCDMYMTASETALNIKTYSLPSKDCSCSCGFITCLKCKFAGHQPISCEAVKAWKSEIEGSVDKLNLQWKKNNTKKCPKCKVDVFKNTGCMHMVCFNCKHNFCWLCLGGKESHPNSHFASCNNPPSEDTDAPKDLTVNDQELSKLKFCLNRYLEHENSLKITLKKYKDSKEVLAGNSINTPTVNKFLQRFPGSLEFYLDSYRELISARSFLMHTYPLQYTIKNQQELILFFETQHLFQIALENLTERLEENQLESFIIEENGMICPAPDLEARKAEIIGIRAGLKKHMSSLKAELGNEKYAALIREEKNFDLSKVVKASKQSTALKQPEKNEIWTCFHCHVATKGIAFCNTCKRETYQESYGAWVCTFCSNPQQRTSEICSNGYCKKGKRPKEALGYWKCNLCGYDNLSNQGLRCSACNQTGRQ